MYSKKVKLRFVFIIVFLTLIALTVFTVLEALKDNVVYFKSPSEINLLSEISTKKIRVGGMVKDDSIIRSNKTTEIYFTITDYSSELKIYYKGILPDLFREGQGVVVRGYLDNSGNFIAEEVLAKHDETYMPPEVAESLGDKNPDYNETTKSLRFD